MSMCDFNSLSEAEKLTYHNRISRCAQSFGGTNFFLQLLEAIRETKPHPLIAKNSQFSFDLGGVKWNKVIFKDKLTLLMEIRLNESKNGTLIPDKEVKNHKKVMNLLRTIKPIVFEVYPSDDALGEGFQVHPFEVIGENITRLDPIFDALFFCSVDTIKKILNYTQQ
ncbi:MAG: hypothetical protein U9R27_09230 [Campylobacterota bacterium]|nr:hypothetical protein [Campylobacterota bacterium]